THVGQSARRSFSMRYRVFAIGLPYGMLFHSGSTASTGYQMFHRVVSVGPPTLITRALAAWLARRPGRVTGIQSPPRKARRRDCGMVPGLSSAYSRSISIIAGTEFHIVTSSLHMS